MPEKPKKFVVSLVVNIAVFGHDEAKAREEAQEWLRRTVRRAASVETNLVVPFDPVVSSRKAHQQAVHEVGHWDARDNAAISAERNQPEYVELIDRLISAETTDEYLLIRQEVLEWKTRGDRQHAVPLVPICNLLDTLAEAVRWSEGHANGPVVWNLGGLFARLKTLVQTEYASIHKWQSRQIQ